jgi:hypothetical protein
MAPMWEVLGLWFIWKAYTRYITTKKSSLEAKTLPNTEEMGDQWLSSIKLYSITIKMTCIIRKHHSHKLWANSWYPGQGSNCEVIIERMYCIADCHTEYDTQSGNFHFHQFRVIIKCNNIYSPLHCWCDKKLHVYPQHKPWLYSLKTWFYIRLWSQPFHFPKQNPFSLTVHHHLHKVQGYIII